MIKRIYSNAFKKDINKLDDNFKVSILTGGLKSAVYLIEDSDFQVVLKFSNDKGNLLSLDANSFWWEANVLKNFDHEDTCIPYLYYYDSSCELSDEEYLFMSYLDGENYTHIKEKFTKEEQNHIEYVIGVISKKICSHIKEKFFLPSNPSKQFESNYDFTSYLFNSLFQDAKKYELDISEIQNEIQSLLSKYRDVFDYNLKICCVPTDLWDGNVIIKNKDVVGVVDVGDFYYCDELMTFKFHPMDGDISDSFLQGFGKETFSEEELIRMKFYRIFTLLKTAISCKANNYGYFDWLYNNMNSLIDALKDKKVYKKER